MISLTLAELINVTISTDHQPYENRVHILFS